MVPKPNVSHVIPWASGPGACVIVYDEFESDLAKATEQDARKIRATLKSQFCEFGYVKSSEKWNDEGSQNVGGIKVKLHAAKAYQCRAYGVIGSYNGKKAFFLSYIEPKKKTDKANPQVLAKAAVKAVAMIESISGAKR